MTIQEIISIVGLIGIGGLIKSIIDYYIEKKKIKSDTQHSLKETRYKAIILLCYALINYEKEKNKLLMHRPDIKSKDDLLNELKAEWINMILYASDNVFINMSKFLINSDLNTFNNTLLSMRKDLYGIKSKLKNNDLKLYV